MKFKYFLIFFIISSSGCISNEIDESKITNSHYAKKFEISSFDNFDLLKISNPWQKASKVEFTYCLAKDTSLIPDSLNHLSIIKVPVESAIVFSTTHIGYLKSLSKKNLVIGASGANYIFDSELAENVKSGKISEIGYPPAINFEKILERDPDIVFLYGLESTIGNMSQRIESAGIPTLMIADFLEKHPLGKAEWIKVFAALTDTKQMADSIFTGIENNYNRLCKIVEEKAVSQPTVLLGLPWKDTWYMAGGESITAKLLFDSGSRYLWSDNESEEFIPLSVEAVMSKALHADFWLNPGSSRSLDGITGRDSRYSIFEAFQKGNVFNNDNQLKLSESNNFWEEGVVQPDLILMDMIKIFHPELMNEHDFVYYRKLK